MHGTGKAIIRKRKQQVDRDTDVLGDYKECADRVDIMVRTASFVLEHFFLNLMNANF